MKKISAFFLALLSGLLLFAAWPVSPFTFLIFIAFVPLLILETRVKKRSVFFGYSLISFLIWNAATTWWTCNSTLPGGISAIIANSLLMSIPWLLFFNVKKRLGPSFGYPSLLLFWLSFEYIHLNWQLSWPWLTLGNVFATHPDWVQWYSITGTSGGSLWVMLTNLLIFHLLPDSPKPFHWFHRKGLLQILNVFIFIAPFVLSYIIKSGLPGTRTDATTKNIVVVQPNVDPWDEKFVAGKEEGQIRKLISLSLSAIDSSTALVVWPETAVPVAIEEDSLKTNYFMQPIWYFLKEHPSVNLLTGMEGFRFYDSLHQTKFTQHIPNSHTYEEIYNSAVLMDVKQFQVYHKSRLVPGAEILPSFIHFMEPWFEKFGGTTGGYATQLDRTVLKTSNQSYAIAPAVCYESIYGEFLANYLKKGANLIVIITNDGWWGNTAGYKQHESYARLRAIETRCWIARSANTGISCFIDPSGKVIDPQPWNTQAVIKFPVPLSDTSTFFVAHGDLISNLVLGAATLILLVWLLSFFSKKKPREQVGQFS